LHADVEQLAARYLLVGSLSAAEVERFRNAVASLTTLYKGHITVEDSVIFPLAARLLTQVEKMDIAEEMTRRRGVEAVPQIDL
jgi:hemerythrin-like domain-containing protein